MGDLLRFLPSFCHLLCFCILFVSFVYGARELADDLSTKGARALLSSGQGIKLPLKKSGQITLSQLAIITVDLTEFAGLLGLEFSENSFIRQTTEIFSQIFGYCLPSLESSTGFLVFGDEAVAACSPQFRVPLVAGPNGYDKYYVDLVAITIGEKRLQMPSNDGSSSSSKVILDSGTPFSHLSSISLFRT
ncbi:hypothetical protein Patl1_04957 [Pistacia atlantica]|uniref:Uncharacterized protein n=1 Tax=Pistacia atlantica TaxID=434234 RepID=A0ACC1BQS9_9ROSI|nr:hypothetical protein Patl1_04957 [Pistacia atlantica]